MDDNFKQLQEDYHKDVAKEYWDDEDGFSEYCHNKMLQELNLNGEELNYEIGEEDD